MPAVGSNDVSGLPGVTNEPMGHAPAATFAHEKGTLLEAACGSGDLWEGLAEKLGDVRAAGASAGGDIEGIEDLGLAARDVLGGGLDDAQPFVVGGSVGRIDIVGVDDRVCSGVPCGTADVLEQVRVTANELGQPGGRGPG